MDVVTAFLYGFLNKVIYIKQPYLFITELNKVCKLIKALYRLKQATHVWYKTFVKFFKKLEFTQLLQNYGIFVSTDKQLFITIYFDNLFIFGLDLFRLKDV